MHKRVLDALLIAALVVFSDNALAKRYLSDIQNGRAFRDLNGNGMADGNEPVSWTDLQGNFQMAPGKGRLHLQEGSDRATGILNAHLLTAPATAGSFGVVTTAWQALLDRRLSKLKIARALNVPISASPSQYKAVAIDRLRPGTMPVTLLKRNGQLQNLLRMLAAFVDTSKGAGVSAAHVYTIKAGTRSRPAEDALVGIMADALNGVMPSRRRDSKPLDLADAATVKRILERALKILSMPFPGETELALAAQALAEINGLIWHAGPNAPDLMKTSALRGVVLARLVAEGRYLELGAVSSRAGPLVVSINPDTGKSDTDGVTSEPRPIIAGLADDAAVGVRVSLDNGMTGIAELEADRRWTWTLNEGLTDGSYRCTAVSIASDGIESQPSAPMVLVVDTTPPKAATVNAKVTLDPAPNLTGIWSPEGNALQVKVNGKTYSGAEITTTDTTWSLSVPSAVALPSGLYDVATRVTDLAGNFTEHVAPGALLIQHKFSHLFSAPTFLDTGPNPFLAKLADFNNDGKLDLAVIGGYPSVSVFPGNGDGTFQAAIETAGIDKWSFTMSLGNLDSDGNPDLLIGSYLLLGNGDFSFRLKHLVQDQPGNFELADLTGDGLSDLVGIGYPTKVYVNGGNAGFPSSASYSADSSGDTCAGLGAAGDLNGDGKMDIVHLNSGGCIAVQFGNGDGTLGIPANYGTFSPGYGVLVHDVNKDGSLDIVSTSSRNGLLLNEGDGRFSPPAQNVDTHGDFVAVDDFDGDNAPDIALTRDSGLTLLMNDGNGSFSGPYTSPVGGAQVKGLLTGDLNGDGKPDLIMTDFGGKRVAILLNQGN